MQAASLREQTESFVAGLKEKAPAFAGSLLEILERPEVQAMGNNVLKVGDKMPEWSLPDAEGKTVKSSDLPRPLVVTFYRGGWCPVCNLAVRAMQKILPEIQAAGGTLVAVAPTTPDNTEEMVKTNELTYTVVSDVDNVVSKQFGLLFRYPEELRELYVKAGKAFSQKYNGNDEYEVPIPGTFVVDKEDKIAYVSAPVNYTKRAEPSEVLAALKALPN